MGEGARWHSTLQGHLMIDVCEEIMVRPRAVLALVRLVCDARKHTCATQTHTQTHIHTQVRSLAAAMEMLDYALRCLCVHSHRASSRRAWMEALPTPHTSPAPHATADAGLLVHGMDTACSSTYKVLNEAEGWWWTGRTSVQCLLLD